MASYGVIKSMVVGVCVCVCVRVCVNLIEYCQLIIIISYTEHNSPYGAAYI